MDTLKRYKTLRKVLTELNLKILSQFVSQDDFYFSAKRLGIFKDNMALLQSAMERDALFDISIYGKFNKNQSALTKFMQQSVERSEMEMKVLEAMKKSDNLLYEVLEVNHQEKSILLKEVSKGAKPVKIIDIGLSETLNENVLLFTRLITVDDLSFTSGLIFNYPITYKELLLKESRRMAKVFKSGDPSADRFYSYFILNRMLGIGTITEEVK